MRRKLSLPCLCPSLRGIPCDFAHACLAVSLPQTDLHHKLSSVTKAIEASSQARASWSYFLTGAATAESVVLWFAFRCAVVATHWSLMGSRVNLRAGRVAPQQGKDATCITPKHFTPIPIPIPIHQPTGQFNAFPLGDLRSLLSAPVLSRRSLFIPTLIRV